MSRTGCGEGTGRLSAEGRSPRAAELFCRADSESSFLLLLRFFTLFSYFFSFGFGFRLIVVWLLRETVFRCAKSVLGWPCGGGAVRAPLAPSAGAAGAAQGGHSGPRAPSAGRPSGLWAGSAPPAVVAAQKESRCCCIFHRKPKCSKWELPLHTARVSSYQSSLQWFHRHAHTHPLA